MNESRPRLGKLEMIAPNHNGGPGNAVDGAGPEKRLDQIKSETPRGALTERHQDRMTLTHAIARLTYGSAIGHRYNVDSDGFYMSEGEARRLRSRNLIGPSTSGLPGTEHLRMPEGKALSELVTASEVEALREAMNLGDRGRQKWREAEANFSRRWSAVTFMPSTGVATRFRKASGFSTI